MAIDTSRVFSVPTFLPTIEFALDRDRLSFQPSIIHLHGESKTGLTPADRTDAAIRICSNFRSNSLYAIVAYHLSATDTAVCLVVPAPPP